MRDYRVTIVIPSYNHWDLTERLLQGLYKHERDNIDEIIISDDASPDPSVSLGVSYWTDGRKLPVVFLGNFKNRGFLLTSNEGLYAAIQKNREEKHLIFLISNDVEIRGKFVGISAENFFKKNLCLLGNRFLSNNTGWNKFGEEVFPYLEGYFLATTAPSWIELNLFDTRFAPNDYEDVDLSTTAKRRGYSLVALNSLLIYHQGGGTYGYTEERRLQTERNREKFRNKWVKQ